MAQTILQLEFEGKKMPVVIGPFDKIERIAKLALAELIEKILARRRATAQPLLTAGILSGSGAP